MATIIEEITASGIVAIVRMEHYNQALEIGRALLAGGIAVIEFTLTGRGALQAIAATRQALEDRAKIGAGTVLDPRMAREAIAAGAQFVVTPVMRVDVIEACQSGGVPILCGAFTPKESSLEIEAERVEKGVDPVGAGDGFNAGFLAGWLRGYSLEAALRLGGRVGAAAVARVGDYTGYPRA